MDDFVATEDDAFAPPSKKRRTDPIASSASVMDGKRTEHLDEIHRDVVDAFVLQAKELEEKLRNDSKLRQPLFTEAVFRQMAMCWTTKISDILRIKGIDQEKAKKYGPKFLPLVNTIYEQYLDAMGSNMPVPAHNQHDVIDLVSSDTEEDFEDYGLDGDGDEDLDDGPSKFFTAPVRVAPRTLPAISAADVSPGQAWRDNLEHLKRISPNSAAQPPPQATSSRSQGGSKAWRRAKKYSSGGVSKRSSGGGTRKKASGGKTSRGTKPSAASGFFGKKNGRGGGGNGSGGTIGLMPL